MELELFRHDLVQTSSCARGTLVALPVGEERKTQKIACGDLTGVVQCFNVKKGEISLAFKTMPCNLKVTSVSLGKGSQQRDRIFVASGSQIRGMSKKGKEFFKFNTQVTEAITKVDVHDLFIWSSAEYVHNMYLEGKDKAFFLCPDRINSAELIPLLGPADFSAALACQDRHIRLLQGSDVLLDIATTGSPVALLYVPEAHDLRQLNAGAKELLYSNNNGMLMQLLCDANAARQGFQLANPKKLGAIKSIFSGVDFTKTGMNDIVIGREDGSLEVLDMDENGQLQQVFSAKLNESINSLDGGFVTTMNVQEVVLQTFSGKVLTYAPAGGGILVQKVDKRGMVVPASEEEERRGGYNAQIQRLKAELAELQGQLDQEQQKFAKGVGSNALLAVSAPFTVQDSFHLEADEACYVLTIECAMPIFCLAIQSNIQLQLLDVPANIAIMSRSPPDHANGNLTLATYRCQDLTSRIAVKFKVREGTSGTLQAFIIPNVSPKTCVSVTHKIKAMCLHQRIPEADASRPTNEMTVTGTFDLSDMHQWLGTLLNDVTPLAPGAAGGELTYQNTLLGTQLTCWYKAGEARFASDFITSLGIVSEHLMREATNANHRVNVSYNPSSATLKHSITMVWPQLEKQRTLKTNFLLLEGLEELKIQDGDVSYLAPEYRSILDNAAAIRAQYKDQPQHLDHLTALIKDLFLDFCRVSGASAQQKQRLPALEQILNNTRSTLDDVMDFMLGKI